MEATQQRELRVLADRASEAFRKRDLEEAVRAGDDMRRLFPNDSGGWFHSARALREAGKLDEVEALLAEAPLKFANDLPILSIWTSLPRARRDIPEALRRAYWLLDNFPNDPSPYTHVARCLLSAGRRDDAKTVLIDAIKRWPDDVGIKDTLENASKL